MKHSAEEEESKMNRALGKQKSSCILVSFNKPIENEPRNVDSE